MLDLPSKALYGLFMDLFMNSNALGVVVTLTKPSGCENCGEPMPEGSVVKHLRGVGYQHLNCDALEGAKGRHPTNRKAN